MTKQRTTVNFRDWEVVCLLIAADYTSMHGQYGPDFEQVSIVMKIFTTIVLRHFPDAISDSINKLDDPYGAKYCRKKFYQLQSLHHNEDLHKYTEDFQILVPILCNDENTRLIMLCVHVSRLDPSHGPYHGNFLDDYARPTHENPDWAVELEKRYRQVERDNFYEITCERCVAAHRHHQNRNYTRFADNQKLVHRDPVNFVSSLDRSLKTRESLDLILNP
jgi:hypothetical protein